MPELPEVETARRALDALLRGRRIVAVQVDCQRLRRALPRNLAARLQGGLVQEVVRRAKYLLLRCDRATLLCHLGMTGTWRLADAQDRRPHDHLRLSLDDGRCLVYRDPRRFGLLDLIEPGGDHPALADLGIEPLDAVFDGAWLHRSSRRRRGSIKGFIMDQRVLVGVGNIYAQEALFRARLRPGRPAGRLAPADCDRLVAAIRTILRAAIAAGGSTVSDWHSAGGDQGWFQLQHQVYGRAGEPCLVCGSRLRGGRIGGRGTAWCGLCQK